MVTIGLCFGLGLSLVFNLFLFFYLKSRKKTLTLDAKDLLKEVLSGHAIIQLRILDPENILIRSPQG